VKTTLLSWIQELISNYSFDGLRLDTVPEIEPGFWADFQQAANIYAVGEVWSDITCSEEYQAESIDGTLSYPM
jgi:alpha-amylase